MCSTSTAKGICCLHCPLVGEGPCGLYVPARITLLLLLLHVHASALAICSGVDVYTAMAAGMGASHVPLHGESAGAVIDMLEIIGSPDNLPDFLKPVRLQLYSKRSIATSMHANRWSS